MTMAGDPAPAATPATPEYEEIAIAEEMERFGGAWLGAARDWIKWTFLNGSAVTWSSNDVLRPPVTVAGIERCACRVMRATVTEVCRILRARARAAPAPSPQHQPQQGDEHGQGDDQVGAETPGVRAVLGDLPGAVQHGEGAVRAVVAPTGAVEQPAAAPVPGTATREEFELLVTALEDAAILYGVNRGALRRYPPTEARAALIDHHDRLLAELERLRRKA